MDIADLIARADEYKAATGIADDSTVSYRVFGDTKKLGALRRGADITTRRFKAAMLWFDKNCPASQASKPPEGAA
ncbi:hypothetical protein [Paracoccus kondratievae]|uniref:Uncharacterized protein n=1 Tax=Paracoccus kondratievae TaxID=135740 RepID=A0AAD3RUI2_9RHOB|nr:hypothetical protein [Paracoccus kondratievae]GLK65668.1 hypothetical protein GCM10017635_31450 [Paracoccus kondratievae]